MSAGAIRKMCMAGGGPVKGPGTGKSDSVAIMASNGEFVMPADSTRKIGVKVLMAMRDATHDVQPRLGARKMANGGKVKGYADGGLIDEEKQRQFVSSSNTQPDSVRTGITYQPSVAPVGAPGAAALTDRMNNAVVDGVKQTFSMPGTSAVVSGAADDASQQFKAGNPVQGVGQLLRGALTLPLAAADDLIGRPARAAAPAVTGAATGVGNALYTAATGDNTPAFGVPSGSAPTPAPTPAPTLGARPAQTTLATLPTQPVATAPVAAPVAAPAPSLGATPPQVQANPPGSIVKTILNEDGTPGKVLRFGPGGASMASLGPAGWPTVERSLPESPQVKQDRATGQAQARLAAGVGTAQDAIAVGMAQQLAQQNAAIQNAADAAGRYAGGSKKLYSELFHAGLGAAGTNNIATNQVTATDAQAQLAANAPLLGAQTAEARAKSAGAISALAAQDAYAKAINSGDPKEIARTESIVRARVGKFEKDAPPEQYAPFEMGVDPATGGKILGVLNKHTGQVTPNTQPAAPLANHISALKANPKLATQFDQQYGNGAAAKYLGK